MTSLDAAWDRWHDDDLSEEEAAALAAQLATPDGRRQARDLAWLRLALSESAALQTAPAAARPARPWRALVAAAVLLIAVGGVLLWRAATPSTTAPSTAAPSATAVPDDGDTIQPATDAVWSAPERHLDRGRLVVEARPRAVDEPPLIITTPHARAEVIGTAFTLEALAERTRCQVDHGRVRLSTSSGDWLASAGDSVIAHADGALTDPDGWRLAGAVELRPHSGDWQATEHGWSWRAASDPWSSLSAALPTTGGVRIAADLAIARQPEHGAAGALRVSFNQRVVIHGALELAADGSAAILLSTSDATHDPRSERAPWTGALPLRLTLTVPGPGGGDITLQAQDRSGHRQTLHLSRAAHWHQQRYHLEAGCRHPATATIAHIDISTDGD